MTNSNGHLLRINNDILLQATQPTPHQDSKLLAHLTFNKEDRNFYVQQSMQNDSSDKLWVVVRTLKCAFEGQRGHLLQQHDVIKFGRVKFKVVEI